MKLHILKQTRLVFKHALHKRYTKNTDITITINHLTSSKRSNNSNKIKLSPSIVMKEQRQMGTEKKGEEKSQMKMKSFFLN